MFGEPGGKIIFAEAALGEMKKGEVSVLFRRDDVPAVSVQKSHGNHKSGALVAVNKRMIPGNAKGVGSRKPKDIRFVCIGKDIVRLGQGRIEQRFIADAVGAAMLGKLFS